MIHRKVLAGVCFVLIGFSATLHSQTPPIIAVRAGRMFDSKTGQLLTKQLC